MHELSVCQSMLGQIEMVAIENHATKVHRIRVQLGPLSGVEPQLLQQAFPIAMAMLLDSEDPGFDCLVAPGHVATVMGRRNGASWWSSITSRPLSPDFTTKVC